MEQIKDETNKENITKPQFNLSSMEKKIIYFSYIRAFDETDLKSESTEKMLKWINDINANRFHRSYYDNCEYCWEIIEKLLSHYDENLMCNVLSEMIYYPFEADNEKKIQKCSANLCRLVKSGFVEKVTKEKFNYFKMNDKCVEKLNSVIIKTREFLALYKKLPKIEDIDSNIEKWKKEFECEDIDYDAKKITNNKETLLDYIKNIVSLDSDIFSLKKRYNTLAKEYKKIIENDYFLELVKISDNSKKEIIKIDEEIQKLNDLIMKKPIFNEEIEINLPKKPIFEIPEPKKPTLKSSNIFNRKKVEEENKILLQTFNEKLKKYNKEYEKYTNALKDYEDEVKELTEKANKRNKETYQKELEEYNIKVQEYKEELSKKNEIKQKLEKEIEKRNEKEIKKTDIYKNVKSIEYELEFIIENIKKDIKLQNKLYSYNVIYGKYRSYIPMSSFIDYLMSGRCDTLDTSTGAYNLYEQESRTDIIINKMDIIIDSLEKIKENQYYIYNQLNAINNSLDLINGQLLVNNILQVVQISQLDTIIEKADEIAYNTKVTAYYTKKTANYTKALTFMNLIDKL